MRDYLLFYVNGKLHQVSGGRCFQPLSAFLRSDLGLIGTKVVCAEGDCGSCTVLIGRVRNGEMRYQSIDSCIQYLYQADGAHVLTVESVREGGVLHPVQQAMVDEMGSQCGYCTPGFVMSLLSMAENDEPLTRDSVVRGLTGNLCRCTGYQQILDAALSLDESKIPRLSQRFADPEMLRNLELCSWTPALIEAREDGLDDSVWKRVFLPANITEAVEFLSRHQPVTIVSGGTDISVQYNKGIREPENVLCLTHIRELEGLGREGEELTIGARVSWSELERFFQTWVPEMSSILEVFGSPQIRNAGTMAGNIANASPIADGVPFLMLTDAKVELAGPEGRRWVEIREFYHGYKLTEMNPDEIITRIQLHLPDPKDWLKLYKVSKRRDLDISTFTAGILLKINRGRILQARLAMGGVAPVVMRLRETEAYLKGKTMSLDTMRRAGIMAAEEIAPISDVRASKDYRLRLASNIFHKSYHEWVASEPDAIPVSAA